MTAAVDAETTHGSDNFKDVVECIVQELRDREILTEKEFQDEKFFFDNAYRLLKYEWAANLV